jgi:hypothetical protein
MCVLLKIAVFWDMASYSDICCTTVYISVRIKLTDKPVRSEK